MNIQKDILDYEKNLILLSRKHADTPAGFCYPEKEEQALVKYEHIKREYDEYAEKTLLTPPVQKPDPMIGREELLQEIERRESPVVLYGISGIGKTTLAKTYAWSHRHEFEKILILPAGESLMETICDDIHCNVKNMQYATDTYSTRRQYFKAKYAFLKEYMAEHPCLLILHRMNIARDRDFDKIFSLPCRIIITTNLQPAVFGLEGIDVSSIDEKYWHDFFRTFGQPGADAEAHYAYYQYVQGHPFAMLEYTKNNISLDISTPRNFFCDLRLSHLETTTLQCASHLLKKPEHLSVFRKIAGVSMHTIQKLTAYNLLQIESDKVSIHPVISEAVQKFLPADTGLKRKWCRRTAMEVNDAWDKPRKENLLYESISSVIIDMFAHPANRLQEALEIINTYLFLIGQREKALAYIDTLYENICEKYGPAHELTGFFALRKGALYHNALMNDEAFFWFDKALDILQNCTVRTGLYHYYLAEAYTRKALYYRNEKQWEKALQYNTLAADSLQLYFHSAAAGMHTIHNISEKTLAYNKLARANILMDMKDYEAAKQQYVAALHQAREFHLSPFRLEQFQYYYALYCFKTGQYQTALALTAQGIQTVKEYRGLQSRDALKRLELFGMIQEKCGDSTGAAQSFQTVLEILQNSFPYETAWTERIRQKLSKKEMTHQ